MHEYSRLAYAKINLSLDVLQRREDGYHEVSMVMHQVAMADTVTLRLVDAPGIVITSDSDAIPLDDKNIAYRAAQLMCERFGISTGVRIHIAKRIPVAGGTAGGSTDAAAVLCLMNDACQLRLTQEELMRLGLELGADIPYCIFGRPALAEGIGEKLSPIAGLPPCKILIVNPGVEISTKEVYDAMDSCTDIQHVDNARLIAKLKAGDLFGASHYMHNVMQTVSSKMCPRISDIVKKMQKLGAIHAMMSGSGATCFALFPPDAVLDDAEAAFPGCFVKITEPYWG